MDTQCQCHKIKIRSQEEFKKLINRLNRVEGQVKGVKNMLMQNAYCPDILIQVSAITSALNSFNRELLSNHIKSCVVDDVKNGNEETIDELLFTLQKLMK